MRSGDIDVIILLAANLAPLIHNDTNKKVYFQMVSTSSQKIFDVVATIRELGVDVSRGLPWFHAFTGCDIVSSFIGKGKITIWDSWMTSKDKNQLTALFVKLSAAPAEITDTDLCLIQQFVKYFYNKRLSSDTLGAIRMKMFINCAVDDLRKLPPSEGALLLHSKRATLQAGYLWKESESDITIPNPELWG